MGSTPADNFSAFNIIVFQEYDELMPHFMLRAASYAIIINNKKILLMRRQNSGFYDGYYGVPAGHFDGDESAKDAMVREIKEETGLIVKKLDLDLVHTMHRYSDKFSDSVEYIDLFFQIKKYKGQPRIAEPHKCNGIQWFELNQLPRKTMPYVKDVIASLSQGTNYSEVGFK